MSIFTGAGVAIVTPMNQDGSVNYEVFANIIEDQIAGGTDCIIVCGTTGEASTLSHEEHLECIKFVVDKVNKRIPVVAGTGSNCTETAIYLSKEAEKYGVDGLLVVTPYYNKATQKGLVAHYKAISDAVNVPIILYNVPSRTGGCNILPETVMAICDVCPNVVAIKEASGNISQVAKLASLAKGRIDIYSGNDDQIVPIMALGGKGVISVLSNVIPTETAEMCRYMLEGKTAKAAELQLKYIELIDALFCEVNPIPVKAACAAMGYCDNYLRLPLTPMEPQNEAKLISAMKNAGVKF